MDEDEDVDRSIGGHQSSHRAHNTSFPPTGLLHTPVFLLVNGLFKRPLLLVNGRLSISAFFPPIASTTRPSLHPVSHPTPHALHSTFYTLHPAPYTSCEGRRGRLKLAGFERQAGFSRWFRRSARAARVWLRVLGGVAIAHERGTPVRAHGLRGDERRRGVRHHWAVDGILRHTLDTLSTHSSHLCGVRCGRTWRHTDGQLTNGSNNGLWTPSSASTRPSPSPVSSGNMFY